MGRAPAGAATAMVLVCSLAVAFAIALVVTAPALAAGSSDTARGGNKVVIFEDLTVGQGDVWSTVVVVGGDVVVAGTVEDTIVVVGGDLLVEPSAVVGRAPWKEPDDDAIVSVFGEVTIEPGADVGGDVTDVLSNLSGTLRAAVVEPVLRPWQVGSPLGLMWGFIVFVVVALFIVAVAPRQVAFVRNRVRDHFFSSLGWGALGTFIGVPLSVVVLIVTIVGLLLLAPWLAVVLPVMFLFGVVAVATWIGSAIIRQWDAERGTLLIAAVLGAVILSALWFIPGVGSLATLLVCLIGFGATFVSIWDWRGRARRRVVEDAARRRALE